MTGIKTTTKVCVVCGKEYTRTAEWSATKTCCKECQAKRRVLTSTNSRKEHWDNYREKSATAKRERDRKARAPMFQMMATLWIVQYDKLCQISGEKPTGKGLAEYIGEQMSYNVVLRPKTKGDK